jgi:hypothetical protein
MYLVDLSGPTANNPWTVSSMGWKSHHGSPIPILMASHLWWVVLNPDKVLINAPVNLDCISHMLCYHEIWKDHQQGLYYFDQGEMKLVGS